MFALAAAAHLDRPYLSLIPAPFIVAVVSGVTLTRSALLGLGSLFGGRRGPTAAAGESEPIKETT